jgi:predicted acylesterase/phospholipase RssA
MRNRNDGFRAYWTYGASVLTLSLVLAGCAINRPVDRLADTCDLKIGDVIVELPQGGGEVAIAAIGGNPPLVKDGAFAAALRANVQKNALKTLLESNSFPRVNNLVLSGGGQYGSFGSGFLKGMQEGREGKNALPRYTTVTGVSTGALQATFALLGQEPAPDDRKLDLANDFPADANARPRTNLDDLVSGYTITREGTLYKDKGTLGIIRGAAKGSLAPLAKRLELLITAKTLLALKNANKEGRKLFVALLNYKSGEVESVDMTELASRYNGTETEIGSNFKKIQHCYNQVLIAASSEPIGAKPVVIDRKIYFDAGLRFGVFLQYYKREAKRVQNEEPATKEVGFKPFRTDIIVNGDLAVGSANDKFDTKFSALDIALRGRKILVNQIYRFSVSDVLRTDPKKLKDPDDPKNLKDHEFNFAAIRESEICKIKNCDQPANETGKKNKEMTFDPDFMKALIALGKARGKALDWQTEPERIAIQ